MEIKSNFLKENTTFRKDNENIHANFVLRLSIKSDVNTSKTECLNQIKKAIINISKQLENGNK